jgi:hypothetical protein
MNKKGDVERRRFFCDFAMNRLNNESMSLAKVVLPEPNRYFLLRVFLVAEPFAAPAIAKSSTFFPPFIAATSHLGLRPRPAQVSAGFSGLRYLGPLRPWVHHALQVFPGELRRCTRRALKARIPALGVAR